VLGWRQCGLLLLAATLAGSVLAFKRW